MAMPGQVVESWTACLRSFCAAMRMSAALRRSDSDSIFWIPPGVWSPVGTMRVRGALINRFGPACRRPATTTGELGNDALFGGDGQDDLEGGSGDDSLRSEGCNDVINGNTATTRSATATAPTRCMATAATTRSAPEPGTTRCSADPATT